jgi:hypothetical protein
MRVIPWRSRAWLSLPLLLASVACAPQLPLEGRAPPCPTNYDVCPTSGICYPIALLALQPDGGQEAGVAGQAKPQNPCKPYVSVRQGGDVDVPVPHISPGDVMSFAATAPDPKGGAALVLPTALRSDSRDGAIVSIHVPHGTPPSSLVANATIVTRSAGQPFTRTVELIISQIAVDPDATHGNDDGPGTNDAPFRTLRHAAAVADSGDTIQLHGSGPLAELPGAVALPANITVIGPPLRMADKNVAGIAPPAKMMVAAVPEITVPVLLELGGDLNLSNVVVDEPLLVTQAGAHTTLFNVVAKSGITIAESASDAVLDLSGNINGPAAAAPTADKFIVQVGSGIGTDAPITAFADRAVIHVTSAALNPARDGLEAVRLSGKDQELRLIDVFATSSATKTPSILRTDGAKTVEIRDSALRGHVDLTSPYGQVNITDTKFVDSGVLFKGVQLTISATGSTAVPTSQFDGSPITIDSPAARVLVRGTSFVNYSDFAIRLLGGHLDLGTGTDPGINTFTKSPMLGPAALLPAALSVQAPLGGINGVTVSGTTFDSVPVSVFPGQCTVKGIKTRAEGKGVFEITHQDFPVDFYEIGPAP